MNYEEKYMVITSAVLLVILAAIVIALLIIKKQVNEPFVADINYSQANKFVYDCKTPLDKLKPYVNNCPQHGNMSNNGRINMKNMGPLRGFHQCFNGSATIPELNWRVSYEHNTNTVSNVDELNENELQPINPIDNVYGNVNY